MPPALQCHQHNISNSAAGSIGVEALVPAHRQFQTFTPSPDACDADVRLMTLQCQEHQHVISIKGNRSDFRHLMLHVCVCKHQQQRNHSSRGVPLVHNTRLLQILRFTLVASDTRGTAMMPAQYQRKREP